jgi:transposase
MVARSRAEAVSCPRCNAASTRVHGRYTRRLVDAAIAGARVVIELLVRRFRCAQAGCAVVTFAEQVSGLTSPHARYTPLARRMVEAIGLALAGRGGARLAGRLGLAAGRDTVLRRVRALSDPAVKTVKVLGVDDFAVRRGHLYGTVLIDLATGKPVDLLDGRDGEPLARWLHAHPGTEVICRDRSSAYAQGARTGAPDAVQVADRFHLWQNLGDAVDKTVAAHRGALAEPAAPAPATEVESAVPGACETPPVINPVDKPIVVRTRQRYADVSELLAQGFSQAAISRRLGLNIRTVRRFARVGGLDELLVKSTERTSKVDPFKEHLHRRWTEGATDAARLTAEITALGYAGSDKTVRRYLHRFRDGGAPPRTGAGPPDSPRHRPVDHDPAGTSRPRRPARPQGHPGALSRTRPPRRPRW